MIGGVEDQFAETKVNQDDGPDRGRLSVPALALDYITEIAERKGMTKGEVVMLAVGKLRDELLAA